MDKLNARDTAQFKSRNYLTFTNDKHLKQTNNSPSCQIVVCFPCFLCQINMRNDIKAIFTVYASAKAGIWALVFNLKMG